MDKSIHIGIHLCNRLMSEAIYQLLVHNGYDHVAMSERSNGFTPHVLLVDSATLTRDLLARYLEAKVLLIDTGMEMDTLCATFLSYSIHGLLSPDAEIHALKKALRAITEGQTWINNESIKALLNDAGDISRKGTISHITDREREIIGYICHGLSNKEIARKLTVSPHTVKSHLNRIFTKVHIASRSQLMALTSRGLLTRSA